jgi:ABC-type phosphate/phosphonate transport system substrate-binding protein
MMINKLSKGAIVGLFFMQLLIGASYADEVKDNITIAILPCSDVVMTFKKFHPLTAYLKQESRFDIRTVVPRNFAEFEMAIKNGEIDFAFQDPHTYARIASLYDKSSLIRALTREGTTVQYGVVIVRRDSNIKTLQDLRKKIVMFGPRLSATKWTAAKELFEKNGINLDKDLKAYSHGGCCEDIAFNVYLRAVDAGIVCDHFLVGHPEKQKELGVEANQMIVVSRTEAVPTRVFAARKGIVTGMVTTVNQALLRLDKNKPAHAKILYNAEIGGFQKSKDRDYDGIRTLIGAKRVD